MEAARLRIQADFNYGGRNFATDTGIVAMSAKGGPKHELTKNYDLQFQSLGVEIRDGLELVLWDDDCLDDGTPAHLEVDAVVHFDAKRGWYATYGWQQARWVPEGP